MNNYEPRKLEDKMLQLEGGKPKSGT